MRGCEAYSIPRSPQSFVGRTLELPVDSSLGPLEMSMISSASRDTPSQSIKFNFDAAFLTGHDTNPFALGIVDYSLGPSDLPQIRGRPSSRNFIRIKTVFPPKHGSGQWKRIDGTGLVELNFPNIRRKVTLAVNT
ncbi:hypothetical protein AZE42_13440 [Rhizopogon vesiculosus]|uniref:Uncharacterized protein n=1 Tax=Rhizopogon vesiculosus TaxID=180088 RepID=A0A1J8Q3G8_9AGAM|nr:hypothetical protein AZE42_13440 [Rhizopogon vesiculosus]